MLGDFCGTSVLQTYDHGHYLYLTRCFLWRIHQKVSFGMPVKWDKVFKNGPRTIYGRQSLKKLNGYDMHKSDHPFKFFKGCPPQIFFGPFLNTLSQMIFNPLEFSLKSFFESRRSYICRQPCSFLF